MRKMRKGLSMLVNRKMALGFAAWKERIFGAADDPMAKAMRYFLNHNLARGFVCWHATWEELKASAAAQEKKREEKKGERVQRRKERTKLKKQANSARKAKLGQQHASQDRKLFVRGLAGRTDDSDSAKRNARLICLALPNWGAIRALFGNSRRNLYCD